MELQFGFKELYDVIITANDPVVINGVSFSKGEPLLFLEKVQVADLSTNTSNVSARGGFDNRAQVTWESTREGVFRFTQGIFSKEQFSLLHNYKILQSNDSLSVLQKEYLETNQDGRFTLPYKAENVYVYNRTTGQKMDLGKIDDYTYTVLTPFCDIIVFYKYAYTSEYSSLLIGERAINGFVTLQAKTRTKDDVTGIEKTGIINFPKMQIRNNFALRMGEQSSPVVADFVGIAHPIGDKFNARIGEINFLNADIDAE